MRGRKPKQESRSAEIRQRLMVWKQEPESSRTSLRALARELGTSHQLLKHYLDGLDRWQVEESWRLAKEYRAQAKANGRPMTPWEEEQARILDRRALCLSLEAGIDESLTTWEGEIEQALRDGKPLAPELPKMLRKIGAAGNEKAQAMLRKYFSPEARQRLGLKILRKHTPCPEETITRFEQMGGILLLDGDRILYFVPNKDAKSRALLAELWEHREGVKRIIEDYVRRLTEQGRYEKIKAEICRRIPPSLLSPLDEFKDAVKNSGNSARTPGGERDK